MRNLSKSNAFVIIGLQIAIVAMVAYSLIVVKRGDEEDEKNVENPEMSKDPAEKSDEEVGEKETQENDG